MDIMDKTSKSKLQLFEERKIRSLWDAEKEEWFFSVVDVCGALTEQETARSASTYWAVLKTRLKDEGADELLTNCKQLKMLATDGKMRETDVLETKYIFRLIQSIPSKKAEPFKLWMAQVASERLDEIADPEKAILRGAEYYRAKGYTEGWINQRLQGIEMRKKLTDEWQERGVADKDYAILTNEMTKAWSGMTVGAYKQHKGLTKQNLRDNMTDIELTLNQLAEVTTTAISKSEQPQTMAQNIHVAKRGGKVADVARVEYEQATGQKVVSKLNAEQKHLLELLNKKDEE